MARYASYQLSRLRLVCCARSQAGINGRIQVTQYGQEQMTGNVRMPADEKLRLLLLEQNPVESKLLQELLPELEICAVNTLEDAVVQLKQHFF